MIKELDSKTLKAMFKKATEILLKHKDEINALNVFPVPDGDTGSNMIATMMEGCKYLDELGEDLENDLHAVLKAMKDGTLMGARGNSGVILSQIVRGFAEGAPPNKKTLNTSDFLNMFKKAREIAYSAVIKPVEGTMLTVMRFIDERSPEAENLETFEELVDWIIRVTEDAVRKTPEMLDKLREAGVVDAGAKGLYYIFLGMKRVLEGETEAELESLANLPTEDLPRIAYEELAYQYCTEYVIRLPRKEAHEKSGEVREFLESVGDSVVVVAQDDILKIHVHTNHPGTVLERLLEYGEMIKSKIDNMKIQHEHVVTEASPRKKMGIVAVSPGEGLSSIMKSLGVDEIVPGGQTMNPSTRDIRKAIERVNADHVFVFPNNPNVILAASQASEDVSSKVYVIQTHTPQECISALVNYDPEADPEEMKAEFERVLETVIPISITRAVRSARIGKEKIRKGEYMVFERKKLLAHSTDLVSALREAFEGVKASERDVLSIFTGRDYEEKDLEDVKEMIEDEYPNLEVEVYEGGQPHYPFLMSLE